MKDIRALHIAKQRNAIIRTRKPIASDGGDGDIWFYNDRDVVVQYYKDKGSWKPIGSTFIELKDTPRSYENHRGNMLLVNYAENALEFSDRLNLNHVVIEDDFMSGGSADGTVGALGWNYSTTGSALSGGSDHNAPGVYKSFAHPTTSGNYETMRAMVGRHIDAEQIKDSVWRVRLDIVAANQCWCVGWIYSHSATTEPEDGIYFVTSDNYGDTDWRCITRESTSTVTDTNLARDTSWHTFRIRVNHDATAVQFYIDGTLRATHTTNIPTTNHIYPFAFKAKTPGFSGNGSAYMYIDYFGCVLTRDMSSEGGEAS